MPRKEVSDRQAELVVKQLLATALDRKHRDQVRAAVALIEHGWVKREVPPAPKAAEGESVTPPADDIMDRLMRAASREAIRLEGIAGSDAFTWRDSESLQGLIRAISVAVDLDNRWMSKLDPERLQEKLGARAAAALEADGGKASA